MSKRLTISLPDKVEQRFNKIPEGSRSAVVRNLLVAYFEAYDKKADFFEKALKGEIYLKEKDAT